MKRASFFVVCLFVLVLVLEAACLADNAGKKVSMPDIDASVSVPASYTAITPETARDHMALFPGMTIDDVERMMILDDISMQAFSPSKDVTLTIIAKQGDEKASMYHDIERYTSEMRGEIRAYYQNRDNFEEDGIRYSDVEWTNKTGRGRMLLMNYTVREGEETIARGRQAFTIRNGLLFTLDMRVNGRKLSGEDESAFETMLDTMAFPTDPNMPLLPVGLELDAPIPLEVHKDTFTVRGKTTKGARVSAYYQPDDSDAVPITSVDASSGGAFRMDITLPNEGDTRIYIVASLNGFEDSDVGGWVSYEPKRIPVTFDSYPDAVVTDAQVVISGKTLSGVSIQCMEGDMNKKVRTGSGGSFSFRLKADTEGEREVVLSMTRDGFENRRFTFNFHREWLMEDYVKRLDKDVQSLSYENLSENGQKYIGRIVRYTGNVIDISESEGRIYVELATEKDKDGIWRNRIVAIADDMEIPFSVDDSVALYFEVTGESYEVQDSSFEFDGQSTNMPSVKLIAYQMV